MIATISRLGVRGITATVAALAGIALLLAGARMAGAANSLTATPNPVTIPYGSNSGTTTVSWSTPGLDGNKALTVSVDGGAESTVVTSGQQSGSFALTVQSGKTHVVRLYKAGTSTPLASTTVTTKRPLLQLPTEPDLRVQYDGDVNGHMRFTVRNAGFSGAGIFRIAVLAGPDSYGFDTWPLAAGASRQYTLPDSLMGCGRDIVILVDTQHEVDESNEMNNAVAFEAICAVDSGVEHQPVNDP
jgi:CARDB